MTSILPDLNAMALPELFEHLAADGLIHRLIDLARDEDLGVGSNIGDITSSSWRADGREITAHLRVREDGVVAGLAAAPLLLTTMAPDSLMTIHLTDGQSVRSGDTLASISGPAEPILALERTLLNIIGRLSGIATLTARYVSACCSSGNANVFDTRKTTPGLRALEKYAVRCGDGKCHRLGLYDAVLIKDNHLAQIKPANLAEHLKLSIKRARADRPLRFVEVEVDSLKQLEILLKVESGLIDIVLLDNMTLDQLCRAVQLRDRARSSIQLEASGGVNLESIGAIAKSGVERISVGALTHSARSLDVGLDID